MKMYPNIEAERVRKGMTKVEFVDTLGISLRTYYNWQAGKTAIPSTALKKMASIFGTDIGYLLVENDVRDKNAS